MVVSSDSFRLDPVVGQFNGAIVPGELSIGLIARKWVSLSFGFLCHDQENSN